MTIAKPEFHLQRVNSDGSSEPREKYELYELSDDVQTGRRGFLGTGLTAGALLALIEGTANRGHAQPPARSGNARRRATKSIAAHSEPITALAVTPDGKTLISGSEDKSLKLWSLPEGFLRQNLTGYNRIAASIAVTPDGMQFLTGSSYEIRFWSLPDAHAQKAFAGRYDHTALAISRDGNTLAAGTTSGNLQLWRLSEGKAFRTLGHNSGIKSLAITPNGETLISGLADQRKPLRIWSVASGNLVTSPTGHKDSVQALAITQDGRLLASGSSDNTIRLWKLPSAEGVGTLNGHLGSVNALAMTPDGSQLASGSSDKSIKLWSLVTGKLIDTLVGHEGVISQLVITPDGKLLVSADREGAIILWDLAGRRRLTYLFDAEASRTDAVTYDVVDQATGNTVITYTLPCGSPIPAGATCICNCVPGTYRPAPVTMAGPVPKVESPVSPVPASRPAGTTTLGVPYCTCNKICVCIPVCQAHRLLHSDPVVRALAESLLYIMGRSELAYMHWAANHATGALKSRILEIIGCICAGAQFDSRRAISIGDCVARLDDRDEVVAIMAAQMLALHGMYPGWPSRLRTRVAELLRSAARHPWYLRHGLRDL